MSSLPPVLRHMAAAAAENLQVDPGMTAVVGLAVAALCVQGKFIINLKPGWVEPLNLYASVIARPSERKTPALSTMTRPLYAFEKEENQRRAPLIDEYQMKRDVLKKKIFNMKEAAAKADPTRGKTINFDDITELQYELSDLEREAVKPLRLLADDTTPEALVSLMAANGGKMASSKSNTSVAQLGDAILTIGGTAKNLAGGTTELSTALGILADNGVKGAEGGTALRNIILSLSAPTDTAAKAMQSLGLEVYDAHGNMRPLNETFGDLQAALSSMTQGEQTQALSKIF